jgi:hypothetical protein
LALQLHLVLMHRHLPRLLPLRLPWQLLLLLLLLLQLTLLWRLPGLPQQ